MCGAGRRNNGLSDAAAGAVMTRSGPIADEVKSVATPTLPAGKLKEYRGALLRTSLACFALLMLSLFSTPFCPNVACLMTTAMWPLVLHARDCFWLGATVEIDGRGGEMRLANLANILTDQTNKAVAKRNGNAKIAREKHFLERSLALLCFIDV